MTDFNKDNRLCHGALNIPLRKRGCIDAQLDKHKAQQAKEARQRDREMHKARLDHQQLVRDIKARIKDMSDDAITVVAARAKIQRRSVRKWLREDAGMDPRRTIKILDWADGQASQGGQA